MMRVGPLSTPWNRKSRYSAPSIPPAASFTASSVLRAEARKITHRFSRRGIFFRRECAGQGYGDLPSDNSASAPSLLHTSSRFDYTQAPNFPDESGHSQPQIGTNERSARAAH